MVKHVMKLKDIVIDPKVITRKLHLDRIMRLIELIGIGEYPDPPLVTMVNGTCYLLDGNHRIEAYKRTLDGNAEIAAEVTECADFEEMVLKAYRANKKHGWPYTDKELSALLMKLQDELGFSRKQAREELGISEKHAAKWTPPPKTEKPERASVAETPIPEERARICETPMFIERAMEPETPIEQERARRMETPTMLERAKPLQSASVAPAGEVSEQDKRELEFHVNRMLKKVPDDWKEIQNLLLELAEKIREKCRE